MKEVKNHLFFDGYSLTEECLKDEKNIEKLLVEINEKIFDNKGKIKIIPYFNGKIKTDGGVSGLILGDNFHFTCHTFCYKNTVFIDYFGEESRKEEALAIILANFKTDDYDLGLSDIKGNFGKHIIINPKPLSLDEAKKTVKLILKEIEMTPICDFIVNSKNEETFDILQPIAESHISFHREGDNMTVDAFSCKYFDIKKFLNLFDGVDNYIEVNRGIRYK